MNLGNELRSSFSSHPFFSNKLAINVNEFSVVWHYRQNQMMAQLLQAYSLIVNLKAKMYKELLRNLSNDKNYTNYTLVNELFNTFTDIIREETGGENIPGESATGMSHTKLLEDMLMSLDINIKDLIKIYNPLEYNATSQRLELIEKNTGRLIHHIAWMEVFENIAKMLFDKIDHIYQNHNGDKRFINFHQAIEGGHGEKNDSMTNLFLKLYPKKKKQLQELIAVYERLRKNVLTEFSEMTNKKN